MHVHAHNVYKRRRLGWLSHKMETRVQIPNTHTKPNAFTDSCYFGTGDRKRRSLDPVRDSKKKMVKGNSGRHWV